MAEEGANPPGVPTDWKDHQGVIALETAVLVHALRYLLQHGAPQSHALVAGAASRLLEVATLACDWATAEAILVLRCADLARKPALAPYAPSAGALPRHPILTTALLPLSAVYAQWGRSAASGSGAVDSPIAPQLQARRRVLAGALGLTPAAWEGAGLGLPLGEEGGAGPSARQLLEASNALAESAAGVLEGAWGSVAYARKLRTGLD